MNLLAGLKCFFNIDTKIIDNYIFRLHYKVTFYILITFAILVKIEQYLQDPIRCFSRDDLDSKTLNQFCWIHGTYSILEAYEKEVGVETPYFGIVKYRPGQHYVFHTYYRWVYYVLFLQAICFYMPGYFWKRMEGGKICKLIQGLNSSFITEDAKMYKKNLIVEYMVSSMNHHNFYFMLYTCAEIFNFVNVIGQIFLMNAFLGGEFLSSVPSSVFEISGWGRMNRYDPILKIFPRLAKCTFYRYGSSGDVQRHEAMCLLLVNNINEKIYIFLYFWFVTLAVLSGLALLYRAVIIFYPKSRLKITSIRVQIVNPGYMEAIINKCKLGDWLILNLLSKNLDPLNFRDIVNELARRLDLNNLSGSNISLKMMNEALSV